MPGNSPAAIAHGKALVGRASLFVSNPCDHLCERRDFHLFPIQNPANLNTYDGKSYRLDQLSRADVVTLGDILCGNIQHPEVKSLGPDGKSCKAHTRGLLRRMTIKGGLQHCIGKEVSRFEQGKDDFIENIDDECIHYDGGRVTADESLILEISARGLRRTAKATGLDRKTIRGIRSGKRVKASTLAKIVMGLREELTQPFPDQRLTAGTSLE